MHDIMRERTLHHVAIAVPSLSDTLPLFERLSGGRTQLRERVESQGVEVVFIGSGPVRLELIQPISPESTVARFLARRGPGIHHMAYQVPSLSVEIARLRTAGIEILPGYPRLGAQDSLVAFLDPKQTAGALIELIEVSGA